MTNPATSQTQIASQTTKPNHAVTTILGELDGGSLAVNLEHAIKLVTQSAVKQRKKCVVKLQLEIAPVGKTDHQVNVVSKMSYSHATHNGQRTESFEGTTAMFPLPGGLISIFPPNQADFINDADLMPA